MKKVKGNLAVSTGCVKLYLDDILAIIESMQEAIKDGELEITVGGYELSNLGELAEIKGKEHEDIKIDYRVKASFSWISFWVDKKHAYLSCPPHADSLALRGAFSNIERILQARRRKWEWVETPFYIAMSLGTTMSILLLQGQVNKNPILINIGFGIAATMLIALALFLFTIPVRKSKIILVEKSEHSTFWKRNQDTLLISSISSVISFLLGILGTLFVQSLGK